MKRGIYVFFLVVFLSVPAFAQVDIVGPKTTGALSPIGSNAQAGATSSSRSSSEATGIGVGVGIGLGGAGGDGGNANASATSYGGSGGYASQGQIGVNVQDQDQFGYVNVETNTPRPFQNLPDVHPFPISLVQGSVANVTGTMPRFAGILPYNGEPIVEVRVFKGSIFDRIRLEDVERDVLKSFKIITGKKTPWYAEKRGSGWPADKVRFVVHYKDSVRGAGVGGGGNLGGSGMSGDKSIAGSGAILPGITRATVDPQYVIKFYLTQ